LNKRGPHPLYTAADHAFAALSATIKAPFTTPEIRNGPCLRSRSTGSTVGDRHDLIEPQLSRFLSGFPPPPLLLGVIFLCLPQPKTSAKQATREKETYSAFDHCRTIALSKLQIVEVTFVKPHVSKHSVLVRLRPAYPRLFEIEDKHFAAYLDVGILEISVSRVLIRKILAKAFCKDPPYARRVAA